VSLPKANSLFFSKNFYAGNIVTGGTCSDVTPCGEEVDCGTPSLASESVMC
jgi:hypothetical protein